MVLWLLIAGYFLPTWIGAARNVSGLGILFVLNLALGWMWPAWAIMLFMACAADRRPLDADEPATAIDKASVARRVEPHLL